MDNCLAYEDACRLAQSHLDSDPFPDPSYRWVLSEGKPIPEGWYFEYRFEPVSDDIDLDDGFGGAPGYVVSRSGIRIVGWDDEIIAAQER